MVRPPAEFSLSVRLRYNSRIPQGFQPAFCKFLAAAVFLPIGRRAGAIREKPPDFIRSFSCRTAKNLVPCGQCRIRGPTKPAIGLEWGETELAKKHNSRAARWLQFVLLLPLPIIAFLIWRSGGETRRGLFESALSAAGTPASMLPIKLHLPAHLPGAGFAMADTSQYYDEENLYVKIDGHDVAFFRFGFVSLTFAAYAGEDGAVLDVYAYRMDRRENALGVYAAERSDDRTNLSVAEAGYESGGAVFFYRGPWYVQIIPSGGGVGVTATAQEMLDSLCRIIPVPTAPSAALAWFPAAGRVENSDGYFPDNAFGVDFISDVFTTQYYAGGGLMTVFRHWSDSAGVMLKQYCDFLTANAEPHEAKDIAGVTVARYIDYGEQIWLFVIDDSFIGLTGSAPEDDMEKLANELIVAAQREQTE